MMQRAWVATGLLLVGCGSVSEDKPDARMADAPKEIDAAIDGHAPTCVSTPPNLKARYRAENNANDHTTTFNGTEVGANFGYTPGKYGSAFLLDGTDDTVTINDGDLLWASGSFSLEAWIKTSGTITANRIVLCKYACGGSCPNNQSLAYFCMYVDTSGHPSFDFRPDGTDVITTVTATLATVNDGQWHHLVGVRDATAMTASVYVDGALSVSSNPAAAQFGPQTNADNDVDLVTIGSNVFAGQNTLVGHFAGAIDEVAIYHSALTAQQISGIFTAPEGKCP